MLGLLSSKPNFQFLAKIKLLKNMKLDLITALTGAALVIMQPQLASALTANQVENMAVGFTVLIRGVNSGSGVIISRDGNTYYVLTSKHVVETEDEYSIYTNDGQNYLINYQKVIKWPGVDLALVTFESTANYPLATLANYDYDRTARNVFILGWPDGENPNLKQRLFTAGMLINSEYKLALIDSPISNGYELYYTNITAQGMSGGPILDTEGRVIGIHGATAGVKIYDETTKELLRVKYGFSSGVPIATFLKVLNQSNKPLNLRVNNGQPGPLNGSEAQSIAALLRVKLDNPINSAIEWVNVGNQLYRMAQFHDALIAFDNALNLSPNLYLAWYGKANVLSSLNRANDALLSYDKTTKLKPDFSLAWRDRAALLANINRYEDALASFEQCLRYKPDDFVAWYMRGNILGFDLKQFDKALESYDQALNLQPNFVAAWTAKGDIFLQMKRYQDALKMLDRALSINPNKAENWGLKGTILMQLRDYNNALSFYEKAVQLESNNYQFWLLKGVALASLSRFQEAQDSGRMALKLQPNNTQVKDFLRSLNQQYKPGQNNYNIPPKRHNKPANNPGNLW